jgi:hypothetical protein
MYSYKDFRARSLATSWYAELGHMPTKILIAINNAQTAVTIYDLADMSAWMVFNTGTNTFIYSAPYDIKFLDGVVYTAHHGTPVFNKIDFMADSGSFYQTDGKHLWFAAISARNANNTGAVVASSIAVVNDTANAVAAIRDPLGSVDEFGRPKHRVAVATTGGQSVSDAGITAFYDSALTDPSVANALTRDGFILYDRSVGGRSLTYLRGTILSISADAWNNDEVFDINGGGSSDMPWTSAADCTDVAVVAGGSVVQSEQPISLLAYTEGFLLSHMTAGPDREAGLTFAINDVANWPPYSSTVVDVWALESVAGLFGKDFTDTGAGATTFSAGVIGNCAVADGTNYLAITADTDFDPGIGSFSFSLWLLMPVGLATTTLLRMYDGSNANPDCDIRWNTTALRFQISDDNGVTNDTATFTSSTIDDGLWHHIGAVLDRESDLINLYLDGELVGQETGLEVGNLTEMDSFHLFGFAAALEVAEAGTKMDQVTYIKGRALSAVEVKALHARGRASLQVGASIQILNNADMDYIQVSPRGSYAIFGDEDYAYVADPILGVILEVIASPGGNIQDAAVWETIDGYDYSLFCSTAIKVTQTDPNVYEALRR